MDQAVLNAIPDPTTVSDKPDEHVLASGIRFRLKAVPPFLMREAHQKLRRLMPRPPVVHIEDKDTQEENPNDPAYKRAMEDFDERSGDLINAVYLCLGSDVTHVPDGVCKYTDTEWADNLLEVFALGGDGNENMLVLPDSGRKRYYAWLKFYALAQVGDFGALVRKIQDLSGGTREEDVAQATDSFPDNEERGADTVDSTGEAAGLGDTHSPAVGAST